MPGKSAPNGNFIDREGVRMEDGIFVPMTEVELLQRKIDESTGEVSGLIFRGNASSDKFK